MAKKHEELSYAEAMEQIQQILKAINENTLDVDALGQRVERATELISLCRAKLLKASEQIDKALEVQK